MKILMVSVFSYHFVNWTLQLRDSGHEIYWVDVHDSNTYVKRLDFVQQTVKWKNKFDFPGRQKIKKYIPALANFINKFNQRKFLDVFQQRFDEIQPDVVHSFEMHSACIPIRDVMKNNPKVKWIYSSVGSDLYYYQNAPEKLKGIKAVFTRLNYMFSDSTRDFLIAKNHGFEGEYLGAVPGGGGYEIDSTISLVNSFKDRKIILIKGYQNKFGRCNTVLEALLRIEDEIQNFQIIVFGANEEVLNFVKNPRFEKMKNLEIKGLIGRSEVLELMGGSLIYIGNSISDGLPNTLLEAIIMEAFPIQSNPGGSTEEIIDHKINGFLIENPENSKEIAHLIKQAIQNPELLKSAIAYNSKHIKPNLDRNYIINKVLNSYALVEENLKF